MDTERAFFQREFETHRYWLELALGPLLSDCQLNDVEWALLRGSIALEDAAAVRQLIRVGEEVQWQHMRAVPEDKRDKNSLERSVYVNRNLARDLRIRELGYFKPVLDYLREVGLE